MIFQKFNPPIEIDLNAKRNAYNALSDFLVSRLTPMETFDDIFVGIWTDVLGNSAEYAQLYDCHYEFDNDWYEGGSVKVRYIIGLTTLDDFITKGKI